jgi:hypothetical protein
MLFPSPQGLFEIALRADRHVLARRHRRRACHQTGEAGGQHRLRRCLRRGDTDDQRRRGRDAVLGAKHGRAQPPGAARHVV